MGLAFDAIEQVIYPVAYKLFESGMKRYHVAGKIFKEFGKMYYATEDEISAAMIDLSITYAEKDYEKSKFMDSINVIKRVCNSILNKNIDDAKDIIEKEYKHYSPKRDKRSMNSYEKLEIFMRDGFIDRYTGKKLLFPNVLRILSINLGNVFPFHNNWKMSDCHRAYWELFPTCDHIKPIAVGGNDSIENIVTTSMNMNSAKSNFSMEEIGFNLHEKGNIQEWDGMISWYLEYFEKNPDILQDDDYIKKWHKALVKYNNKEKIFTIPNNQIIFPSAYSG